MSNYEKYVKAFVDGLELDSEDGVDKLEYQGITAWDSVGHMALVAEVEDVFDIEMETDDIVDFSSFAQGKKILEEKYQIQF